MESLELEGKASVQREKACGVVGRDESTGKVVGDEVGRYGGRPCKAF